MPARSATSSWLRPRSSAQRAQAGADEFVGACHFGMESCHFGARAQRWAAWTSNCIVVGAGPAGLSAALTLGRARRRVLVLDSGKPRNHAARAMHGVLGHDGLDPAALRARGVEELARYGIEVRAADVRRPARHRRRLRDRRDHRPAR